jgi:tRNA pseudouridine55 synthase
VIDKPAGITSHDVVDLVRRRFGERRVGHGGTLDPSATGVLLVAVGSATRLLQFLSAHEKRYQCEIVLGVETDTLDADGRVTAVHALEPPSPALVREVVAGHLLGEIQQVPPMVSAVRVDGRRLHELAREGVEVERAARPVSVYRFDVAPTDDPLVYTADVACSAGTYVRVLAADLGHLLGAGAHLRALRRTGVGPFDEAEAAPVEEAPLLPPAEALRGMPSVVVDADTASLVANGRVLERFPGDGPWAVLDDGGSLLAVYAEHRGGAKPVVVLTSPVA